MPRFSNHEIEQFWEIQLVDNELRTKFGAFGGESKAETSVKSWPLPSMAKAEYERLVAYKVAHGFEPDTGGKSSTSKRASAAKRKSDARQGPLRNLELEAQIAKSLDDVEAFRVYGDWLAERGDPRGELIALQTKRGHDKAAKQYIEEHREHLLGNLHELSEQLLALTWRNGFVDSVRIEKIAGSADNDDRTAGQLLRALLEHPSGAFVRSLSFGTVDGIEDGHIRYESIGEALEAVKPPHVRSIYVGDWAEWEVSWSDLGDASAFWKLPSLQTLTIRAGSMELGKIETPSLRELEIITGGLTTDNIASLVTAKTPALETLRIYFGSSQYNASGGVADLAPLLAPKRGNKTQLAKVKHLGLVNAEFTDELCAALSKSPFVRQLSTLDLSKGTLSSAGVDTLVANKATFAHLDELVVSDNWITAADVKRLAGVAKKIVSSGQRSGDDRYVSLGE